MTIRVCLAGATGWAGSELARGIAASRDLELVSAISRSHAGKRLGDVLGIAGLGAPIFATAKEALASGCDVFVEYTKPDSAKGHVLAALGAGASVVVATSGLSDADYAEVDAASKKAGLGVLACGNFALTVVLMQKFAEAAAKVLPQWEIIDYAHDDKPDSPSGTARELAFRLSKVRAPAPTIPVESTRGVKEARGGNVAGTQVHSLRLPGYLLSTEIVFGLPDQRLGIRHDTGTSSRPYVDSALLAIRKVSGLRGLHRGLDTVLDL